MPTNVNCKHFGYGVCNHKENRREFSIFGVTLISMDKECPLKWKTEATCELREEVPRPSSPPPKLGKTPTRNKYRVTNLVRYSALSATLSILQELMDDGVSRYMDLGTIFEELKEEWEEARNARNNR